MPLISSSSVLLSLMLSGAPALDQATLPPVRAELEPKRFRLRTGSLGIGAGWRPSFYGYADDPPPCGFNYLCGTTPRIDFDFELGSRRSRLLVGLYTAPMPYIDTGDVVALEVFMVQVGAVFGGPNVRGGIVLDGGALNGGASALLRISPWVDGRGHRHGIDLRVSGSLWIPLGVSLSYRWFPRGLERKYF